MAPSAITPEPIPSKTNPPKLERLDANSPSTTTAAILSIIERDGGVIIENFISKSLAQQIKDELKPVFDSDIPDKSGFFPTTTQRATGLLAKSAGCNELVTTPLLTDVCNALLTDTFEHWYSQKRVTQVSKPIISSTVGFRVLPGGTQQVLHRDDVDYHITDNGPPMLLGCVTAVTKTTKENGATVVIPGSHKWGPERCPYESETVSAELEPGDTLIFTGHVYHAGGANTTVDDARETIGFFFCKGHYRSAENLMLEVPPEVAKGLSKQVQRLLGYGIAKPSVGFYKYQDPMRVLFGVEDEETVNM